MADDPGRTHFHGDGCDDPHGALAPGSPSEAIRRGLCPVCLGDGETFHVVLDRLDVCSGCGGGKTLAAMMALQCVDPHCPDHGTAPTFTRWEREHDPAPPPCPRCGEPMVPTTERAARWACRPCVLLVIPMEPGT